MNVFSYAALVVAALYAPLSQADSGVRAEPGRDAVLRAGSTLTSPNGNYKLVVQGDGNVVIYRGNCVGDPACHTWQTVTHDKTKDPYFVLQSDGNLVVYAGPPAQGGDLFSIGVSGQNTYALLMQDDGNLVVYARGGDPVWSSMHGRVSASAEERKCGGNDIAKAFCSINKWASDNGMGNVLSGNDFRVTNTKSGKCENLRKYFPGGDIGREMLRSQYPADRDYVVDYGECA